MMKWLTSFFQQTAPKTKAHTLQNTFTELLEHKLDAVTIPVIAAFEDLIKNDPPEAFNHFHIEVFHDTPDFTFQVFAMDKDNCQLECGPALRTFARNLDRLWPLFSPEERDSVTVWEDDPKWGRQEALYQPVDDTDIEAIAKPWFAKVLKTARGVTPAPFTFALHDRMPAKPL